MAAELVPLIDREGRNVGVVIAKATFGIEGSVLRLEPKQEPLAMADAFVGEPGASPMRIPSDLVDFKPATDVVVVQPEGGPEKSKLRGRKIAVEVGPVKFGGSVGKKWEFGPLMRDDKQRRKLAGTYDKAWTEERMPLLPEDFDPRYQQVAPPKQVARGYLKGDEAVRLSGLYDERKKLEFELPGRTVLVAASRGQDYFTEVAMLDTVLVWSDRPRVSLVWRHAIPTRQKIDEIGDVFVHLVGIRATRELYGKP